ncbi:MAG: glycosyltransferase family 2 protein [Phycisphaerae bacterium]|nr:glycosyltransferase family 2 protein [Phycisphaerae bacterium]MDW8261482.1 glycosyltransferase family 2 protein [Phycisphaerales bacterium]
MPLISVVIPTYNGSSLLMQTLETVFSQTFTDFEVVIINDGSTDDTADRLAALGDRVRVITQANAGIGAARNRGIDEARGRYVALLDHDDLWMPEKLAVQAEFMAANPDAVGCAVPWAFSSTPTVPTCGPEVCDARGIIQRPFHHLARGIMLMFSSAILFDKEKARGLRYETRPMCIEDLPFQVGLLARGPFGIAGKEILMIYRVHERNFSRQAAYFYNGQKLLRQLEREGRFDELQGQSRDDLREFLASAGRVCAARQILGGYRLRGLRLYFSELPHQLARMRLRFLLSYPILLALPTRVARRFFPGDGIVY